MRFEVEARAEACRRAVQRQRVPELGEEEDRGGRSSVASFLLWELYEELNEKKRKLAEEDGEDDESESDEDSDEEPDEDVVEKKKKPARPRHASRRPGKPRSPELEE